MKKLPKLYKNFITKNIKNNKDMCYIDILSNKKEHLIEQNNIDKTNYIINKIFNGVGYPYNKNVYIKTKNKEYNTNLVIRNKLNIVTIDNELIPINEIIEIKIK